MPNTNCLAGIRCPECGQEKYFRIRGVAWFNFHDDGADEFHEVEWDDKSGIICQECNHAGTVGAFQEKGKKETG